MILNYLKIALRVFSRNKLISFINLLGLSLGIAVFAISIFYVDYEYNFERFQPNQKRIYRICDDIEYVGTPPTIGRLVAQDFPEVESMTRIGRSSWSEKVSVKANGNFYYEDRFYFVDSSFFQTFDYELLLGHRNEVLSQPYTIVINEKAALKYFGKIDAVGEIIEFEDKLYTVSGIAKNVPQNSHFHFDLIAPFRGSRDGMFADLNKYWGAQNYYTYVKFKRNVSVEEFHQKLIAYAAEKYTEYRDIEFFEDLYFQPIRKAHIEIIRGNLEAPVNKKYLLIYVFVAIIILIVASINYINLSIAASLRRAKEVGLRKVVGAYRTKIRNQFLGESIFFTITSLALSFVFIESFIPMLNKWFDIQIFINYLDLKFLGICVLIILWVGLISGFYPSFVVSRLEPIKVLRSGFGGNKANVSFRNILMLVQFIIAICLIISSILISKQMNYVDELDLGFDRRGVVNIPLHDDELKKDGDFLKQQYALNPNIQKVSTNSFDIKGSPFHQSCYFFKDEEMQYETAWFLYADREYFETYRIRFIQGTTFPEVPGKGTSRAYVINKMAAQKYFGDENPIGQRLSMYGTEKMGYVVGVIDNFNFRSLHHPIEPLVFTTNDKDYDYLSLRIDPIQHKKGIAFIEAKWNEMYPNYPFEMQLVESEYQQLYKSESKTASLILVFSVLSLLISSMGLFGINSLVTKYRIREISVRKVFGASVTKIVLILSSNVARLILLASLIAWPLAYYFMDNWLNNFMYRIEMQWYVFVFATLVTTLVSWITVSYQAIDAANTNPAETLKFE